MSYKKGSLYQGIGVSIFLSLGMYLLKIKIEYTSEIVLLSVLAILFSFCEKRLLCLSYILPCAYFSLKAFGFFFELESKSSMNWQAWLQLTSLMHLGEGILTYFYGSKSARAILTYEKEKLVGGYEMVSWWPIFLVKPPLCFLMSYKDVALESLPQERSKQCGIWIGLYGVVCLGLIEMERIGGIELIYVMILVPLLHEAMILMKSHQKEAIFTAPKQGIRVLEVEENSIAEALEIEIGFVITHINRELIAHEEHYQKLVEEWITKGGILELSYFTLNQEVGIKRWDRGYKSHKGLGIIPVPKD